MDPASHQSASNASEPRSLGELLRRGADEELCEQGCAYLSNHLKANPADQARLDFEKSLRQACGRVMNKACCPESLRERIRAMGAMQVEISPLQTRQRSFWAGSRVRRAVPALAAAAVLIAGSLFIVNLSRYASGVPSQASFGPVASFVSQEHRRCMKDPATRAKFVYQDLPRARPELGKLLGHEPTLPRLEEAGLRFVGAGFCGVPNGGKSAHLRFETDGSHGPAGQALSLFVQQASDESVAMEDGQVYLVHPDEDGSEDGLTLYAWRRSDLLYFLVASDLPSCEKFRAAVGLPEAVEAR